ncbi:hypothetical protein [Streptomyces sp. NPDC093149]|uniref:hypothetical protein n=1 Tax=Streptomyces sp. NPDC093149 TaxID=3366031 RepID=UPI0038132AF1
MGLLIALRGDTSTRSCVFFGTRHREKAAYVADRTGPGVAAARFGADATALFHDGCIGVASVVTGRTAEDAKVPACPRHCRVPTTALGARCLATDRHPLRGPA